MNANRPVQFHPVVDVLPTPSGERQDPLRTAGPQNLRPSATRKPSDVPDSEVLRAAYAALRDAPPTPPKPRPRPRPLTPPPSVASVRPRPLWLRKVQDWLSGKIGVRHPPQKP